ncbi:MAG: beta-galactosidase [Tannerella sp.]|nr:beta-galactosidase [Tannerella sp.]
MNRFNTLLLPAMILLAGGCQTATVNNRYAGAEPARQRIAFNDGWEFKKDTETAWEKVTLPHTWNNIDMQTLRNNFYAGTACYRKTFRPDSALKEKRLFLRFEGVGTAAEVYVNNEPAGNHRGGYAAFAIDITGLLKFGEENRLLVKVDNAPHPGIIPVNHRLFGVYGGIYRPVELIITGNIHIPVNDYASPGIHIQQEQVSAKSARIRVKVKIDNRTGRPGRITVHTTLYDMEGRARQHRESPVDLPPQGRTVALTGLRLPNPRLWQGLEDPYLYKITVRLIRDGTVIDEVVQPLGLRRIELRAGDGMYLNGKKIPMYGVCRHQDRWQAGSALTNSDHDTDLAIIRESGATTIRLAHYQQAGYFYARCDSIGFLVWAEIPFVNRVSTLEADNAKQQLTELIRQNCHHPSIYVWGLHNEVYRPHNYTAALTQELNDLAKSEDPGRYTAQASGYNRIDHPVNNFADIQGINQYFGWYNGTLDSLQAWVERAEKQFPDHRIMLSEYGAEANINQQKETVSNRGDCCGFDRDYNETFATRFHEEHWNVIAKHPFLTASYVWNMFDFATPMSSQGQVEARNMKGLVTFDRKTKKDPFYWYKANWSKEPVLYITRRRVVNRGNRMTSVTVYSNVGPPILSVNGEKIPSFTQGYTDIHYIFTDVMLKEGENTVEAKAGKDGRIFRDTVIWNCSEKFRELNNRAPEVRLEEHTGL